MGRREVKTRCGSGSPCRAPEVLVHMVTASACLGRHAKHLQPLWHAEGLMESPCPSLLSQDCITCPGQDAHSCPPRGCRDTHVLFAKGCLVKLPLCRVAACAILQAEPPFHMAGQHMNCPKSTGKLPGWKSLLPCHSSSLFYLHQSHDVLVLAQQWSGFWVNSWHN